MPSGPENRFIQAVHRLLTADVYRMKNHNPYNSGIPDCWYSGAKGDLWVEYKFIALPKRDTTVIDLVSGASPVLSVLQQQWLIGRDAEGRNVGVIIGAAQGGVWLPKTTFRQSMTAKEMQARLMSKHELAALIKTATHQ